MKRLKLAWERMAYQEDGGFSITRLTMCFASIWALSLIPIGIILKTTLDQTIPDKVYDYTFNLTGINALQYAATKIKQGVSEYITTKTPAATDNAVAKEE